MGIDTEETGDEYERMYAASHHVMFRPSTGGLDKHSDLAIPRECELPVQRQEGNIYTEYIEHSYEYNH